MMVTNSNQNHKRLESSPSKPITLTDEQKIALSFETFLYVQRRLYGLTSVIGDTTRPFNTYKGFLGRFIWILNIIIHFSLDFYEAKFLFHASWATSIGIFFICFVSCTIYTIKHSVPWYIKLVRKLARNELHVGTMKKLKFIYRIFPFLMPCLAASGAGAQFGCYAYDGALRINFNTDANSTKVPQAVEVFVNVVRMTSLLHIFYAFFFYLVLHLIILYTLQSSMQEFNAKMRNKLKEHPPTIPFHSAVNLFSSRTKILQQGSKKTTIVLTIILISTSVSFVINAYNFLFVKRLAIYVWFALAPLVWTVSPLVAGAWVTWTYRKYKYVVIQAWVEIPEEYEEIWNRDDDIKRRQKTSVPSENYRRIIAERDKELSRNNNGSNVRNRSKSAVNIRKNPSISTEHFGVNANKEDVKEKLITNGASDRYCRLVDEGETNHFATSIDGSKSTVRNRSKSAINLRSCELIIPEEKVENQKIKDNETDKINTAEDVDKPFLPVEQKGGDVLSAKTSHSKSTARNRSKSAIQVRSNDTIMKEEHTKVWVKQKESQEGLRENADSDSHQVEEKIIGTATMNKNDNGYVRLRSKSAVNVRKSDPLITVSEAPSEKVEDMSKTSRFEKHIPKVTVGAPVNSDGTSIKDPRKISRQDSEDSVFVNIDSSLDSNSLRPVKRKYGRGNTILSIDLDTLSMDTVETNINDTNVEEKNNTQSTETLDTDLDVIKTGSVEDQRPLSARVTKKELKEVEDISCTTSSLTVKKCSVASESAASSNGRKATGERSLSTVSFAVPETEHSPERGRPSRTYEFSTVVGVRQQLETLKKKVIKKRKFNYEKYIKYLDCILVTIGFSVGGVIITWDRASFFCVVLFTLVGVFAQEAFLKK